MKINSNWIQIYLFGLLILISLCCQDSNCITCNTYIGDNADGALVQTCSECVHGYKLQEDTCVQNKGLIIGISIAAAMAIVIQIVCYIYCKSVYGNTNKKKVDLTLEDIYKGEFGQVEREGQMNIEIRSQSRKPQHLSYMIRSCGACRRKETSIRTHCGHYFHHECFKQKMIETNEFCPHPDCVTRKAFSPIEMICIKCLRKQRSIGIETISHFKRFHEYVCFMCKMKTKKQEDDKKWWRRCC